MRSAAYFLIILLFAGSTVFMGAKDIRARLAPPTAEEHATVKEMLKDMQGDNVIPAVTAAMEKGAMPDRSKGSYLVKRDIDRIKSFLISLIHADEAQEKQ